VSDFGEGQYDNGQKCKSNSDPLQAPKILSEKKSKICSISSKNYFTKKDQEIFSLEGFSLSQFFNELESRDMMEYKLKKIFQ